VVASTRALRWVGGFGLSLLGLGCAHGSAASGAAPAGAPNDPTQQELARLRHDDAALRRQVKLLEERLGLMERRLQGGGAPEVPVVSLRPAAAGTRQDLSEPSAPSPIRGATPRTRAPSISLANVPHSAPDADELAGLWMGDTADVQEPAVITDDAAYGGGTTTEAEPEPAPPAASGDDRPSFRLVGSRLVSLTQERAPTRPDRPERRTKRGRDALADYEAAMTTYRSGEVVEAEQLFDAFARAYPRHDYADNALYWKGEAAYDQHHYADALAAFTAVVERYGGGNKAPDALLKIGLSYDRLGDRANARDVLTQLIAAYPQAQASDIARAKLVEFKD
jgi:tol-pal system protein YbgF